MWNSVIRSYVSLRDTKRTFFSCLEMSNDEVNDNDVCDNDGSISSDITIMSQECPCAANGGVP